MSIYISGKIGGMVISDTVRRKFARAEAMLRAKGHDVFNPCDEKWQATLRRDYEREKLSPGSLLLQGKFPKYYTYCLLRDQMVLSSKDAVYMMHDWKRSPGATAEYYFALAAEKEMFFEVKDHASDWLKHEFFAMRGALFVEEFKSMPWNEQLNIFISRNIGRVWLPLSGKEGGL